MNGIRSRASNRPGRLVTRIGCIRAREALKARTLLLDHTSRPGFRKDPGLFAFSAGRRTGLRVPSGRTDARWRIGLLFNKLPRTRLHHWMRRAFAIKRI